MSGCGALAADARATDALSSLLEGCGRGRLLGGPLTGMALAAQLAAQLNNVHKVCGVEERASGAQDRG